MTNLARFNKKIPKKIAQKILALLLMQIAGKPYKPRFDALQNFENQILNLKKGQKMKLFIFLFVSCGVLYSSQHPIPLDPEASGLEYRAYFIRHPELLRKRHSLDVAVKFGKRFLDWLIYVNDHRPSGQKISLSHKTTQPGFPIESPGENNPTLVLERLDNLKKQLPTWMSEVIENKKSFTEKVFIELLYGLRGE
jgi:hypothetical protein